jgi:hypothetical protein
MNLPLFLVKGFLRSPHVIQAQEVLPARGFHGVLFDDGQVPWSER